MCDYLIFQYYCAFGTCKFISLEAARFERQAESGSGVDPYLTAAEGRVKLATCLVIFPPKCARAAIPLLRLSGLLWLE